MPNRTRLRAGILTGLALGAAAPSVLPAQVAMDPGSVIPTAFERFALRVVNQSDTPTVAVRVIVPEAIQVLGVNAPAGWSATLRPASDTAAPVIEWSGGELARGGFTEFAFLGRVAADARPGSELVFPVRLTRAGGATVDWAAGGSGRPPTVAVEGTAVVTSAGAFALAGAATGLAILALVLALTRRRS
jgi:uncharacterized protein YcnI